MRSAPTREDRVPLNATAPALLTELRTLPIQSRYVYPSPCGEQLIDPAATARVLRRRGIDCMG
jgi:hypothetical protein